MSAPRLVASYASADQFLQVFRTEMAKGGVLIHGAILPPSASVGPCVVELRVGALAPVALDAQIAASIPGVGVAVMLPDRARLQAFAQSVQAGTAAPAAEAAPAEESIAEEPAPEEHEVPGTTGARLRGLTVAEKMSLALSGSREERTYLLRDTNKALHLYVLRNPRIGLDEVLYAAKLSTLAPDAIKFIAEHKEWGLNPSVCAAIARNPKTPVPLVLRILPRVPLQDIRAIAKGTGRAPIVQAARKILAE